MLTYSYRCDKCGCQYNVDSMGSELYVEGNYDKAFDKFEEIECPECKSKEKTCEYDPCFDSWKEEAYYAGESD